MMALVVVIQKIVVGGWTQRNVGVELANLPRFLNNAPPRTSLFSQLTQDSKRPLRSFVIKNIRMGRIANRGDTKLRRLDLEDSLHCPLESKLEREHAVLT